MDVIKVLESRYSTKQFDATKKIDAETLEKVKTLLQKSPSSTNIQPWHFVIAATEEGKKRVTKATQGLQVTPISYIDFIWENGADYFFVIGEGGEKVEFIHIR